MKKTHLKRVAFYIDGFNLYHAIDQNASDCKWIDLMALARAYTTGAGEHIQHVLYYTAYAFWNKTKKRRHRKYVDVIKDSGVKVVLGKYREVGKKCRATCKKKYKTHEEKMTDVNIALGVFIGAMDNRYDKAVVISGDGDLAPALERVRHHFPSKELGVIVPYNRKGAYLQSMADPAYRYSMSLQVLKSCQLSDPYTLKNGATIHRPQGW